MIEKQQIYMKPTRKLLDLTFWLGHICIIAALMITAKLNDPQEISTLTLTLFTAGSFTLIAYFSPWVNLLSVLAEVQSYGLEFHLYFLH
jgi:hypothetical protein